MDVTAYNKMLVKIMKNVSKFNMTIRIKKYNKVQYGHQAGSKCSSFGRTVLKCLEKTLKNSETVFILARVSTTCTCTHNSVDFLVQEAIDNMETWSKKTEHPNPIN